MRLLLCLLVLFHLFNAGCAIQQKAVPDVAYQFAPPTHSIDYVTEVKPVLVKRCVVCHSCYNSPCQLKLSSWEGLERGASKEAIYNASRLKSMDPSRLFVDAQSTEEWRQKRFHSVTGVEEEQSVDNSVFYLFLDHKRLSPDVTGDYYPEASELTCAENAVEVRKYLKKHPNRGMPFGFPPLEQKEFDTVAGWLLQGAHGPSPEQQAELIAVPSRDQVMVDKWESFLNIPDPKYKMTARYLFDHLFLAHISFETGSSTFYELVRSKSGPGEEVDVIPSVRPYDDPGNDTFYYRFRKIHSTIVHKTHMVFPFGEEQFNRVKELFITPEWSETPHVVSYDRVISANPFEIYEQIPPIARYKWLLDNAEYIIMTFIHGPVCKGQVALNCINDHFWIMFLDPESDLSLCDIPVFSSCIITTFACLEKKVVTINCTRFY